MESTVCGSVPIELPSLKLFPLKVSTPGMRLYGPQKSVLSGVNEESTFHEIPHESLLQSGVVGYGSTAVFSTDGAAFEEGVLVGDSGSEQLAKRISPAKSVFFKLNTSVRCCLQTN